MRYIAHLDERLEREAAIKILVQQFSEWCKCSRNLKAIARNETRQPADVPTADTIRLSTRVYTCMPSGSDVGPDRFQRRQDNGTNHHKTAS